MKRKLMLSVVLLWCLTLLAGCTEASKQGEETWVLVQEGVITFPDGESLDLWRQDYVGDARYMLSDGTILLTIRTQAGPDGAYVMGKESFDDLNESAQSGIGDFYKRQGLLYDTQRELENAYAEYTFCRESGKAYKERFISQDIVPSASNTHIICFLTSVFLPVESGIAHEVRLGAVFDRKTGQALSNWDLFTLPEHEARQWLLNALTTNPALRDEMKAALRPEYIILFPEYLVVTFPRGSLPSQEYSYSISINYDKLQPVFHTWAIPNAVKR